ncbi:hypothetical protein R1sor_011855 [Riccia sorocarpa]|uniref:Uncharacterized protein n=1 Tax=Riccia sorocarpa TaxID=122646 RepID=A0ABD3I3Z9_9MARC
MSRTAERGFTIPAPIDSSYCHPTSTQFKIVTQSAFSGGGTYQVQDLGGNLVLKFVKSSFLSSNQVVHDANGNPVVILKKKTFSARGKWDAFRGNKKAHEPGDLLFSMEKASLIPWKSSFRIQLPGNASDEFTLRYNGWASHFKLHHNGAVIAEADMKRKFLSNSQLIVTAKAGVDQAFLASVLVIYREWQKSQQAASSGGAAGGMAAGGGGGTV